MRVQLPFTEFQPLIGFNLELPESSLKTAVVFSLLSVWVLVGLFQYLNRYTKRKYFSIWTASWLFYALFLTIRTSLDVEEAADPFLLMLENWCIATAAILMFWGSFTFLQLSTSQRLIAVVLLFVLVWSYAVAYEFPGELWITIPAFLLLGGSSLFTAVCFYFQRKKAPFLGTGLLTFGFALWAIYLVSYPFLQGSPLLLSAGFLISAVLQLFIATSMIILVLEEVKSRLHEREQQIVTHKTKAELFKASAEMQQDRFQKLFENASDAILVVDRKSLEVLEMNQAARRLLRRAPSELSQIGLRNILRHPSSQESQSSDHWLKEICTGIDIHLSLPEGAHHKVSVRGGPIHYSGRQAHELFVTDLSAREKAQAQLRQTEKLAALARMISGVAHELNNPLTAIKGFSELLLRDQTLEPSSREALSKLSQESQRAVKLVQDFLAFAQQDLDRNEPVSVNLLLQSVAQAHRDQLEQNFCQLLLTLSPGDPCIMGNQDHLTQVLHHLLSNARDAISSVTGPKEIRLSATSHGETVLLQVEDSGPGIPEDILPRIFEPFFTTKQGGTGLGLSVAYSLVAQHGGNLSARNRAGGGASFVIELPLASEQDIRSQPAIEAPPQEEAASGKILIVDDEEALGALLKEMLSLFGHEVTAQPSPISALQLLGENSFDVVISDFRMPEMNGAEFYSKAVQKDQRYQNRFIFITGDLVHEAARDFFRRHDAPRLLKPFQLDEVQDQIQKILAHNARSSANNAAPYSSY